MNVNYLFHVHVAFNSFIIALLRHYHYYYIEDYTNRTCYFRIRNCNFTHSVRQWLKIKTFLLFLSLFSTFVRFVSFYSWQNSLLIRKDLRDLFDQLAVTRKSNKKLNSEKSRSAPELCAAPGPRKIGNIYSLVRK